MPPESFKPLGELHAKVGDTVIVGFPYYLSPHERAFADTILPHTVTIVGPQKLYENKVVFISPPITFPGGVKEGNHTIIRSDRNFFRLPTKTATR